MTSVQLFTSGAEGLRFFTNNKTPNKKNFFTFNHLVTFNSREPCEFVFTALFFLTGKETYQLINSSQFPSFNYKACNIVVLFLFSTNPIKKAEKMDCIYLTHACVAK